MKKLLLGGMLVASMFASVAQAELSAGGPGSISGWGCAIGKADVKKIVKLGPDVGIKHGVVKAGTIIERKVTFKYDFSDAVACGKDNVYIHLTSQNEEEYGVVLVGHKKIDLKFNLAHGTIGHKTVTIKYKVLEPGAWKLTSKFHYEHSFKMVAFTH